MFPFGTSHSATETQSSLRARGKCPLTHVTIRLGEQRHYFFTMQMITESGLIRGCFLLDKTGLKLVYLPQQEAVSMSFLKEHTHPAQIPSALRWTHTDLNAISMPFQSPACRNYLQICKDSSLMERAHTPKLHRQMPTTLPTNQDQHWPQMGGKGKGRESPSANHPTHGHSRYLIDRISALDQTEQVHISMHKKKEIHCHI